MYFVKRIAMAMIFLSTLAPSAYAADTGKAEGNITNFKGNPVTQATITFTNISTKAIRTVTTDEDGNYSVPDLPIGKYQLTVTKDGYSEFSESDINIQQGQDVTTPIVLSLSSVKQSVKVTAQGSPETSVTQATITSSEIAGVAGPFGSAAQALTAAPGVFVYGYGGVAATARSEVVVRGVKGGWSSVNGDILRNGISFLLDGIPMNNMISNNGQWQTTQIPIMDMISDINVDYGPGAPSNRWFDSLGGTVNYVPVQPSDESGFKLAAGADYGSYNTAIEHFVLKTGQHKGWSGILASGYASNDTFRVGTTNIPTFTAPSSGYAAFTKVEKVFENGTFSIGYYHGRNTEYRPNFLPIAPVQENGDSVTTQGLYGVDRLDSTPLPAGAQLYSEQTSGFYSSLAKALWYKHIKTQSDILYGKLQLAMSPRVTFNSEQWYRHGYRLHDRVVNFYGANYTIGHEWYDPASDTIGNKTEVGVQAPHNQILLGGYWMHGGYRNPVATFNPALGTSKTNPAFFASDHLYNDYITMYVQDRIDLFSKKLIITPGAAEQYFRTNFFNVGIADFPNANPANDPENAPDAHKNFLQFAPSVGAQYAFSSAFNVHGNYSITYQNPTDSSFGANRTAAAVDLSSLKAVKSENAEGGFLVTKCPAKIFGTCSLDSTYFHDKLSNVEVVTQVAQISTPASVALASSIYNGVSINFDDAPSRYLQIHGNGIIQHNYFLSYIPGGSTLNYKSYPISNSPKYTSNLGISSLVESNSGAWQITPGLWWQYVGTRYLFSNLTTAPTTQTQPGYGVVNFNMQATVNGMRHIFHSVPTRVSETPVQLSLGVENLFNKEYNPTAYITSGGYFGTSFGGYTLVDPGAPREYIISLNFGSK